MRAEDLDKLLLKNHDKEVYVHDTMTNKIQLIKQEIERIEQVLDDFNKTHNNTIDNGIVSAKKNICEQIKSFIDSLPEEPKFKVGDMVISTNNPSLTYKVLQVGLQNELDKLDYEVEIFNNGKPGIKVGNTFKEHNIHLICCDRMDEWGKLVSEEPASKDLEEEIENYIKDSLAIKFPTTDKEQIKADIRYIARHFAEWQHGKDFDDLLQSEMKFPKEFYEKGRSDMREEMMNALVNGEVVKDIHNQLCVKSKSLIDTFGDVKFGDKVKIIIVKEEQQ